MELKRGLLLLAVGVFLTIIAFIAFSNGLIFQDLTQANFSNGTFSSTEYNGSAVIISSGNIQGNFTSRIFDAGKLSVWNNLSWSKNLANTEYLFAVDAQSDFWKSSDFGESWSLVKDDYNGGDGNGATDMEKNSSTLFILFNQDLWTSSDKGLTWNKINDDYNGGEGQNGDVLGIDNNNYIYIVEGDQDVWRSVDGGITFAKLISNFNGGNGVVLGLAINSSRAIFAVDVHADVWNSLDQGITWNLVKDDYNGGGIGNSVDDMVIDQNNNLYIVDRQDFWKSVDNGVTWSLMNDDVNGAGDSNDGLVAYADLNNNTYVIDGSEDVLRSTDGGTTFTKLISDFNCGNGNVFGLNSLNLTTNISFQVKNCSSSDCSDGVFLGPDNTSSSYFSNSALNSFSFQGRYFQYKAFFSSQDSALTPQLFNVSLGYVIFDVINPNLTILSPVNQTYTTNSILVNISAADDNLDSILFYNGSANITYTDSVFSTFSQGSTSLIAYVNDTLGNENSSSVTFFVDSIAPSVSITSPSNGNTYGTNESLTLDLSVSDSGVGVQRCWYNLNNGANNTLTNCADTFFNVSGSGDFTLTLYANDSLVNEAGTNSNFSVSVGSPTISISSPVDSYLNNNDVTFIYNASDVDLNSCQLWGDFIGNFSLNQTTSSPGNGTFSNFTLDNLNDGTYNWNILCNDSAGNSAFNGNKTFYVDTTSPSLTVSEPTGTKTSRTGVPLNFNVNDSSPTSCVYNVFRGVNAEISNTSIGCYDNSTTFSVTVDADFTLNLYVNDSAGNLKSASSTFTVSTSSGGGNGGGGGGGGSSSTASQTLSSSALLITSLSDVSANAGESRTINVVAKNTGTSFLNECVFTINGEKSSWISGGESVGLAAGEEHEVNFNLQIPDEAEAGVYSLSVNVDCTELSRSSTFDINILNKQFNLEIVNTVREGDNIKVSYNIEELSGEDQKVELQFLVSNLGNEGVAEKIENLDVSANSRNSYETLIPFDSSLSGDFTLLVNINSETYSSFVQENLILGASSPTTGFVIFGDEDSRDNIFSVGLIILFVAFAFFMFRRIRGIRKHGRNYFNKQHKIHTHHHRVSDY